MNIGNYKKGIQNFLHAKEVIANEILKEIEINTNLAYCYNKLQNYEKAIEYFNEAENYSQIIGKELTFESYYEIGNVYFALRKYNKCKECYMKAIKILKATEDVNCKKLVTIYAKLGSLHLLMNNFIKAMKYSRKSLDLSQAKGIEANQYILTLMGAIYVAFGEYQLALDYFQNAAEKTNDDEYAIALNNIGASLINMKEYQKAMGLFQKSAEIIRIKYGEPNQILLSIYTNMGCAYKNLGEFEIAIDYFKSAKNVYKEAFSGNSTLLAESYNNLGEAFLLSGNFKKAIVYLQKAETMFKDLLSVNTPSLASVYFNLAFAYSTINETQNAFNYFSLSEKVSKEFFSEDHPSMEKIYDSLAKMHNKTGNYQMALEYFKKNEIVLLSQTGNNSSVAILFLNMGVIYFTLNQYETAVDYLSKSEKLIEKDVSQDLGALYSYLGDCLSELGKHDEAINFLEKARDVYMELHGNTHPDIAEIYEHIGSVYTKQRSYRLAIYYLHESYRLFKYLYKEKDEYLFKLGYKLGFIHYNVGEYAKALEFYMKIESNREKMGDKIMGLLYINIGKVFEKLEKYGDAIEYLHKGENILGKDNDLNYATLITELGISYYQAGEYTNSLSYYRQAKKLLKKLHQEELLGTAYHNLGMINSKIKENVQAIYYFTKALDKRSQLSVFTANEYNNIGHSYHCLNKPDIAAKFYNSALEIYKKYLKSSHSLIVNTYNNLAKAYEDLNKYDIEIEHLIQLEKIMTKLYKNDKLNNCLTYINLGNAYYHINNLPNAYEYYIKAHTSFENSNENGAEMRILNHNIGVTLFQLDDFEKAALYLNTSFELLLQFGKGDIKMVADECCNIGLSLFKAQQFEKAICTFNNALNFYEKVQSQEDIAQVYNYLGRIHMRLEKRKEARKYFSKAEEIKVLLNSKKDF